MAPRKGGGGLRRKSSHNKMNAYMPFGCTKNLLVRCGWGHFTTDFDTFRWFCHFDDDNYVNVPKLVKLLQQRSWQDDWYLGKPSIRAPLEILNRENLTVSNYIPLFCEPNPK